MLQLTTLFKSQRSLHLQNLEMIKYAKQCIL